MRSNAFSLWLWISLVVGLGFPAYAEVDKKEYDALATETKQISEEAQRLVEENNVEIKKLEQELSGRDKTRFQETKIVELIEGLRRFELSHVDILDRLRKVTENHTRWIREFRALVVSSVPSWRQVVDLASYEEAQDRIARFQRSIPGDEGLYLEEKRLDEAVDAQSKVLQEVLGRISFLRLNSSFQSTYRANEGSAAFSLLDTIEQKMVALLPRLQLPRVAVAAQRQVRASLKNQVSLKWQKMLRIKMAEINVSTAGGLIDDIEISLQSPVIYLDIKNKIADKSGKITTLLYRQYCPTLALREVQILGALLHGIEKEIGTANVTDRFRQMMANELTSGKSAYQTYKQRIEKLTALERKAFTDARKNTARRFARSHDGTLSTDCEKQVDLVVNDQNGSIENEESYRELVQLCGVK